MIVHNLTEKQAKLYKELMMLTRGEVLVDDVIVVDDALKDAFYFQDFPVDDEENTVYRIFNYRKAGYTLFCLPSALECRGVMFEVDPLWDTPLRLASRPMEKFFNYRENPFATYGNTFEEMEDLYFAVEEVQVKEDGSLMSTYIDSRTDQLMIKSRGSVKSEQCIAAMEWLDEHIGTTHLPLVGHIDEQREKLKEIEIRQNLHKEITCLTQNGFTVNMEWCSPIHRIVLPYEIGHLRILNVRCNDTGRYLDKDMEIRGDYPYISANMARECIMPAQLVEDFEDVYKEVKAETGREGYIYKLSDEFMEKHPGNSQWFKLKTDWYCALHHSKDSVTNPRRLFECVVEDGTDDLRQMFTGKTDEETDHMALDLISAAEEKYTAIYNNMIATVEAFYEENKDLDRKDFAIKGQKELDKKIGIFGLAMIVYQGQTPDYKTHFKKQWKNLGLKDEKVEAECKE